MTSKAQNIIDQLQRAGVYLEISTSTGEVVATQDSVRQLADNEKSAIEDNQDDIISIINSYAGPSGGTGPKIVYMPTSTSSTAGFVVGVVSSTADVEPLKSRMELIEEGVSTFNSATGEVEGVNSVSGKTGTVVLSINDLYNADTSSISGISGTASKKILFLAAGTTTWKPSDPIEEGVSLWNSLTGDIDTTGIDITARKFIADSGISSNAGISTAGGLQLGSGISANAGISTAGGLQLGGGISANAGISTAGGLQVNREFRIIGGISANSGISTAGGLQVGSGISANAGISTAGIVQAGGLIHAKGGISSDGGITFEKDINFTGALGNSVKQSAVKVLSNTVVHVSPTVVIGDADGVCAGTRIKIVAAKAAPYIFVSGGISSDSGISTAGIAQVGGIVHALSGISANAGISSVTGLQLGGGISANAGISTAGMLQAAGGISSNAGISAVGQLQISEKVWCLGVSSDHAITTSHIIAGAFGQMTSSGISSNAGAGISAAGGLQLGGGISANAGISTAAGIQFSDGSIASSYTDTIGVYVTNGDRSLTTGTKGRRIIPYNCEVTEWVVTGSTSGSITWDINWGVTSAWPNALASVGFSGNGSAPQLGATASQSYKLITTAWTKSGFSAGDVIQFEIDSISTITDCEVSLKIKRTL